MSLSASSSSSSFLSISYHSVSPCKRYAFVTFSLFLCLALLLALPCPAVCERKSETEMQREREIYFYISIYVCRRVIPWDARSRFSTRLKGRIFVVFGPQESHQKEAIFPSFGFFPQKSGPNIELNKGSGTVQKSPRKRALISEPVWSRYVSEVSRWQGNLGKFWDPPGRPWGS